jgi:type II secretory pathway pseudopilin PulG
MKNNKGFTYIELIIAVGLLAIVVFALLGLYDFGNRTFIQQSSEIVTETEVRDAMDLMLTECRKASVYNATDDTIRVGNNIISFKEKDKQLIMTKRDLVTNTISETVLCYNISSVTFDVKNDKIDLGIYAETKNAKNDNISLESVYNIRKDYD